MLKSVAHFLRLNRIGPGTDKVWKENLLFFFNDSYEMSELLIFLRSRITDF